MSDTVAARVQKPGLLQILLNQENLLISKSFDVQNLLCKLKQNGDVGVIGTVH
jgi:hypothetical protein